ncbi:MAG: D-alanyl-D-alanine carboxypeptidase [Gammaproteobacteria bacterium]|nr:D-alanyl-D-alanine carboxypeptidase [Gammaproteobacteria bacterium]
MPTLSPPAPTLTPDAVAIPPAPSVAGSAFILMDFETGDVLAENKADERMPMASLTKMMTSYVIASEIKAGRISDEDMVEISPNAWAKNLKESSLMFVEVGKTVKARDLHLGIIIQSGNDASIAMAEHVGGTESGFADLMNAHAKRLGMTNTHYVNATGLDSEEHYSTARDLAILARALIRDFPEEYTIYSQKEFSFNGIKQYNRNQLLWDTTMAVDGVKTGHTSKAGYCLVSSATKEGMRQIAVLMGTASELMRKQESKKLLNYGFRYYENVSPVKAGETLHSQRIYMGDKDELAMGVLSEVKITIPTAKRKNMTANFQVDPGLTAPVAKGQTVGKIFIQIDGKDYRQLPLVALEDIAEGGLMSRAFDWLRLKFQSLSQ